MSLFCSLSDIKNESDVEQKILYPLLTKQAPVGLGFSQAEVSTKKVLRRRSIGKSDRKYYYPDYLVSIRGLPVLIVEAKSPGKDLSSAYSEARLYALEVNSQFPHGTNPCQRIVVSNGEKTHAGFPDSDSPEILLDFYDFTVENLQFNRFLEFCSQESIKKYADEPFSKIRGSAHYNTPVSQVGGKRAQNSELVENSYGRTLVFENRGVFDPETEMDRINIVSNAYVKSKKREQHLDPIYRELKKLNLPSYSNTTHISTEKPTELVDKISQGLAEKNGPFSLMIIIGNVGAGKTTFIRYFKTMYMQEKHLDLSNQCEWIFIDMNTAPADKEHIYTWLISRAKKSIVAGHKEIDFEDLDIIKKVYRREIRKFEKGVGKLLDDESEYKRQLYTLITTRSESDELSGMIDMLRNDYRKFPIIVFDNCDKRDRDTQLLMFEVAQWFRDTYHSITILPMRDDTYDAFKNEKPLDTVVKDLVFRIDSPNLLSVLQERLKYIYRLTGTDSKTDSYSLEKGAKVQIAKNEQNEYAKSVLAAIRGNNWAKDVFYRLSDRNIRYGIQLFEDLCKSGHVKAEDIFSMRVFGEDYNIPNHLLMNALLRKNRKYYNGDQSNFINLFYSNPLDSFPDPFVRLDILRFLEWKRRDQGPNNIAGFVAFKDIVRANQNLGHDASVILREYRCLCQRKLILTDDNNIDFDHEGLSKISSAGKLHLRLVKNISYLAACAEDINYRDDATMISISKRISSEAHLSKMAVYFTVREMLDYLENYQSLYPSIPEQVYKDGHYLQKFDFEECEEALSSYVSHDTGLRDTIRIKSMPKTNSMTCTIVSKKSQSLVCAIEGGGKAFLATTEPHFNLNDENYSRARVGDKILGDILDFDIVHESFQMRFVDFSPTESNSAEQ